MGGSRYMQLTCFLVRLDVAPNIDEDMLLCEMNAMGASSEHPKRSHWVEGYRPGRERFL